MDVRVPITEEDDAAAPIAVIGGEELDTVLQRIPNLLGNSDVEGARSFVRELEQRWPDSEEVRYWVRVLAPPKVRVRHGERGRPLDRERAWLRDHAIEYPGCWLAIFGDRLVAANPDLGVVLATVRQTPGAESALVYFQPPNLE